MGLDMYAWKTKSENLRQENENDVDLANWRKHNRLHGFMQMLLKNSLEVITMV